MIIIKQQGDLVLRRATGKRVAGPHSYEIVRQSEGCPDLYLACYTNWKLADYKRYFEYRISADAWIANGCVGEAPVFYHPRSVI